MSASRVAERLAVPRGFPPPGEALASSLAPDLLAGWLADARRRTLDLVADLTDEQLAPLLWELGHLAWFAERWVLRRHGSPPLRPDADALYEGAGARRDLSLPTRAETLAYLDAVARGVHDRLGRAPPRREDGYFVLLSIFHEDMRGETLATARQALGYPAPSLGAPAHADGDGGPHPGDVNVPGGRFLLGALPGEPFVFDNEKWAHPVEVRPFAIARAPVTQGEFAAFVEDRGYARRELWGEEGWAWREAAGAQHPPGWRRDGDGWWRRHFDDWVPLEPHCPVHLVCWHEADAYCRWAGRRLPTEAEWELAASAASGGFGFAGSKRRFPWGDVPPGDGQANLDGCWGGCADVACCPAGDSAVGARQMIGNVWEWTASEFQPYPGFAVDPLADYSRPWFGSHKVLRGGSWATRARLMRNTYRNFAEPHRRDGWAGFRTCAGEP